MKRNSKEFGVFAALDWIAPTGLPLALAVAVDDGSVPDHILLAHLSETEASHATTYGVSEERRHFVFRRCMQRHFVAQISGWHGALAELPLVHGLDQRPQCAVIPETCLSFSSSGNTYLFAAAELCELGVDIERLRPVADAVSLAKRFFSESEAELVSACQDDHRSQLFLTLWSAKEAGLKAKGRGIVSGLNSFTFSNHVGNWQVREEQGDAVQPPWTLLLPTWRASHIVAVMHRPGL